MSVSGTPARERAEDLFLLAFLVALPLAEAAKSIFLALYGLQWLYNRWRSGRFGGPLRAWDLSLLAMPVAAFLSVAFAGLPGAEWRSGVETVTYALLGVAVARAGYGPRRLVRLYTTLLVSTAVALAYGYWELYVTHARDHLELHSVGFFLHSAIYLSIATLALLGALIHYRPLSPVQRVVLATTLLWFSWGVFDMESRLTAGLLVLGVVVLGLSHTPRHPRFRPLFLGGVALALGLSILAGNPAVEKFVWIYDTGSRVFLNGRQDIWPGAITAWMRFPWFGVGVHNFGALTAPQVLAWAHEGYRLFDYSVFRHFGHAHNLYLNTLAERGVVGLLPVLAFLGLSARLLWRQRPARVADPLGRTLWAGALGAWMVTTLGGLFNTTLHHEHALLTTLLIGLLYGYAHPPAPDENSAAEVP